MTEWKVTWYASGQGMMTTNVLGNDIIQAVNNAIHQFGMNSWEIMKVEMSPREIRL